MYDVIYSRDEAIFIVAPAASRIGAKSETYVPFIALSTRFPPTDYKVQEQLVCVYLSFLYKVNQKYDKNHRR